VSFRGVDALSFRQIRVFFAAQRAFSRLRFFWARLSAMPGLVAPLVPATPPLVAALDEGVVRAPDG